MSSIQQAEVRSYHDEGYMVVRDYFTESQMELLRSECATAIDQMHQRMDDEGLDTIGISHRGSRYFIPHQTDRSQALHDFAFSETMADVCRATLGPNAYFFLDQFVVKGPEHGMSFSWHQDAGYITHTRVNPYLTCWIPLDDVTIANGTVYVLPFSRLGHNDLIDHIHDPESNDMIGYAGDDPGDPVEVSAGSLVAFTSHTLHRSTPNTTSDMRRVYLLQYSAAPILNPDGSPYQRADPFVRKNSRVPEHFA